MSNLISPYHKFEFLKFNTPLFVSFISFSTFQFYNNFGSQFKKKKIFVFEKADRNLSCLQELNAGFSHQDTYF